MTHQEIAELLPWYVNATLEERDRQAVEGHVVSCPECASEIEQLRALARALRDDVAVEADPAAFPGLWRHIEAEGRAPSSLGSRLAEWWAGLWDPLPTFARVALVAQLAVIVGLCALLALRRDERVSFETVSGPAAVPGTGARIVLAFVPGVSEEDARRTILGVGGVIVSGPSALGLYTVEVPVPDERPDEIEKVLERLRQERRIVRLAARQY